MNLTRKYVVSKKNIRHIQFCWNEKNNKLRKKVYIGLSIISFLPVRFCHAVNYLDFISFFTEEKLNTEASEPFDFSALGVIIFELLRCRFSLLCEGFS